MPITARVVRSNPASWRGILDTLYVLLKIKSLMLTSTWFTVLTKSSLIYIYMCILNVISGNGLQISDEATVSSASKVQCSYGLEILYVSGRI
jgi:hypothetical protein